MWRFILKRLLRGAISLVLFQAILFALVHAIPGDFSTIAGAFQGRSARFLLQRQFGLDRPLLEQFINWLEGFFSLDLGSSYLYWPTPVLDVLGSRAPGTLLLFLSAAVFAYLIGIWLGKMAAWHRGGIFEFGAMLGGVSAYTSPTLQPGNPYPMPPALEAAPETSPNPSNTEPHPHPANDAQ